MGEVIEMMTLGDAVDALGIDELDVTNDGKWIIEKSDDEDHALVALELLREKYTNGEVDLLPIFAEGGWWAYSIPHGVWEEVEANEIERVILRIKRRAVYVVKDGHLRPTLTSARVASIMKMMCMIRSDENFFKGATNGAAFRNLSLIFASDKDQPQRRQHHPDNRLRAYYDFDLKPESTCPKWLEFLDQVFECDRDKAQKIAMVQEFIGCTLRGEATLYQRVLMLIGEGSNGKSVLCDVVSMLFEQNKCCVPPQQLSNRENRASLVGARLNLVSDMPVKGFKDSDGFKLAVAGDELSARRLFAQETVFRPTAGHLYSANQLPTVPDLTHGFFRRFLFVTFNRTFHESERRPRLEMLREFREELPGITLWALRGARALAERGGYDLAPSSVHMSDKWSAENNTVKQFFLDACTLAEPTFLPDDVGDDWVAARDAYKDYQKWADFNGYKVCSAKTFTDRLLKLPSVEAKRQGGTVFYNFKIKGHTQWGNPQFNLF